MLHWVTDLKTGLKWALAPEDMEWKKAKAWCKKQGGRLPERFEIVQLFDKGATFVTFLMQNKTFWTATPYKGLCDGKRYAWVVDFDGGATLFAEKIRNFNVVCVKN
jgi:hypothetical protein